VAEENFWLRSLLEKHGISPVEIKDYLDNSRAASCSFSSPAAKLPGKSVSPQNDVDDRRPQPLSRVEPSISLPPVSATAHRGDDIGLKPAASLPGSSKDEVSVYNIDQSLPEDEVQASNMATETLDRQSLSEKARAPCPPCCACERPGAVKRDDETSCEDAARIIASMRGHEQPEMVRPELGCNATGSCMVKNITILQMVDEAQ
jgi:hypothetical protein